MTLGKQHGGFTLIEVLVVISIVMLLMAILLPALGQARRQGALVTTQSNLKQLSVATGSYALDYEDAIFSFNWKASEIYLMADENGNIVPMQMEPSDMCAAGAQAIDIMRRRADRVGTNWIEHLQCWMPHVYYSHLIIQDYLASRLPEVALVDPQDHVRLNWQIEPQKCFDNGFWLPLQPEPLPINRRWPYSSSYQVVPATYDQFQSDPRDIEWLNKARLKQSNDHSHYVFPNDCKLATMRLTDVAHTSLKVHMHDSHDRHFAPRPTYFGLDVSRLPLAFFDGAVRIERTADANPGWRPSGPNVPCQPFWYAPQPWEPDTTNGEDMQLVKGFYRWTRGGLKGIDFSGKPLDTGQPTPGICDL